MKHNTAAWFICLSVSNTNTKIDLHRALHSFLSLTVYDFTSAIKENMVAWLLIVFYCHKSPLSQSSLWTHKCSINEITKTHNSQSRNPCCIKFTLTDAVCITVEWLTDQSMVRACSHSKHEILPGSRMWKVNCTHFHSTALACHFLRLSDLPYSLYSVRVATHLSQCSWTGAAVCWQIQPHFLQRRSAL